MKHLILTGAQGLVTGQGSLACLKDIKAQKAFIVTGGHSMERTGVLAKAQEYLREGGCSSTVFAGIGKNPRIAEVRKGVEAMKAVQPDTVIAIGGGSAMDAAKAMLLFYEFPDITFENVLDKMQKGDVPSGRKTQLICAGSTSGTGSEVTKVAVITDPENELKVPIKMDILRPDLAIVDGEIAMTMPASVAAETGMDALTHAIEAYTNHALDTYTEAICLGAVSGILNTLVKSCTEPTVELRQRMHDYQAMAGIGFANVGLGMVHGISHAFGACYDLGHGLANAVILPYVLEYNRQDPAVDKKLKNLSYHCKCENIVDEIWSIRDELGIPNTFKEAGISEEDFAAKRSLLIDHSMMGSTQVNPVKMTPEEMTKMVDLVYYGKKA